MWRLVCAISIAMAATLCFGLLVAIPAVAATPNIPVISVQGYPAPGNTLTVSGYRFRVGETVSVKYDAAFVATAKVFQRITIQQPPSGGDSGSFSATFTVPIATTTGAHTVSAVGQTSGDTAQTTITVKANWSQFGFTSANTRYNSYETAINPSNVANLALDWSLHNSNLSNSANNSATVSDGTLYIAGIGTLFALDATTGATKWTASDYQIFGRTPAVSHGVVVTSGYGVEGWDTATGRLLWMANEAPIFTYGVTVADGLVFVAKDDTLYAFNLTGCGSISCNPEWTYVETGGSILDLPAVANGVVYVADSTTLGWSVAAIDEHKGTLSWKDPIATGFGTSTPVIDNGDLIVNTNSSSQGGMLYGFSASGCGAATCAPLWTAPDASQDSDTPAVANGVVYVGTPDWHLEAFNEAGCVAPPCSPLWSASLDGKVAAAPAVADGIVYVSVDNDTAARGTVYAFPAAGCGSSTCTPLWKWTTYNDAFEDAPIVVNGTVYIPTYDGTLYAFHLPGASVRITPGHITGGKASR
ncbi:MAG: hypothetical protein OJF49_002880 [Ktedonobacterales bacterium]|nr:MAG: hypothetical protein OJF49_002880 [Ktedonobacterales bacterium]